MNPFHLKLQKKSLYKTTLLFLVFSLAGNIIGYKRSIELGIVFSSIFQSTLLIIGLLVFKFQKHLKLEMLVSMVMCIIITYGVSGMLFYGFSASGKFLLFLGPLFFSEYISFKKNLVFFFLGLALYALIAVLIFQDVIVISLDHNQYVGKSTSWIIDGVTLFIISFSGLIIKLSSKKVSMGYLKELEKSDKRFQQIFKNSNEAIILLKDYVIYDCNKKVLDLFECDEGFILNKHVFKFGSRSYKGEALNAIFLKSLSEEIHYERVRIFEWEFHKPSGEKFVLEVNLVKVEKLEEGVEYTQAVLRDVTIRRNKELAQLKYQKELEEQVEYRTEELLHLNDNLLKANVELESQKRELTNTVRDLNQAKSHLIQSEKMASIGVLTAGVAHEINNPLNFIQSGIYSFENILENGHLMGSEDELLQIKKRVLVQMNEGVRRVTDIVKGLNRLSRENKTNSERCDLNDVIRNCLLILNHESKDKCIVKTNFSIENPIVLANEGKLHQVFINIIHNAIQSIENQGEIEITTKIDVKSNKVLVSVKDNGCGIDAENLKMVFDPFYTTKRAENGTGLGLAIVYNIIREQDAIIKINSKLGEGTVLSLVFDNQG